MLTRQNFQTTNTMQGFITLKCRHLDKYNFSAVCVNLYEGRLLSSVR